MATAKRTDSSTGSADADAAAGKDLPAGAPTQVANAITSTSEDSPATATTQGAKANTTAPPKARQVNSTVDEKADHELIPGGDIIGRGVYIRPRQPYELKSVLFNQTAPESSYAHRWTTWEDGEKGDGQKKLIIKKISYRLPGGCAVNPSPPMPADQSFGQTLIEESWSRFSKELTLTASTSDMLVIDASAFHASTLKSHEDSYYALKSSFVPLWNLYMPSVPDTLSDKLSEMMPKDKSTFAEFDWAHRDKYAKTFDRYGTHFVKSVWVGGKASLVFSVAKSSHLSTNEISAAVNATLGGVKGTYNTSLETFRRNSSCKVFGSGGDSLALAKINGFEQDAYNAWLDSVASLPAVIQLRVVGIWTLIHDKVGAEALKQAYIRETTFVPVTAIVPIGPYYIFLKDSWGFAVDYLESPYDSKVKTLSCVDYEMAKESCERLKSLEKAEALTDKDKEAVNKLRERLNRKKWPTEPDPRLRLEKIDKFLPFLRDSEFLPPQAALSLGGNIVLVFRNRKCLRLDFNVFDFAKIKADGSPKDISDQFPGVDVDRVDAALHIAPDKLYIFSGPDYYRIDVRPDGTYAPAIKEEIVKGWPGVDFERIDTATYWKNGKVYFFYEDQYIRYDVSNHRADSGYPKQILSNYVEDWEVFN